MNMVDARTCDVGVINVGPWNYQYSHISKSVKNIFLCVFKMCDSMAAVRIFSLAFCLMTV
jgi:hypothetical protein